MSSAPIERATSCHVSICSVRASSAATASSDSVLSGLEGWTGIKEPNVSQFIGGGGGNGASIPSTESGGCDKNGNLCKRIVRTGLVKSKKASSIEARSGASW